MKTTRIKIDREDWYGLTRDKLGYQVTIPSSLAKRLTRVTKEWQAVQDELSVYYDAAITRKNRKWARETLSREERDAKEFSDEQKKIERETGARLFKRAGKPKQPEPEQYFAAEVEGPIRVTDRMLKAHRARKVPRIPKALAWLND